MAENALRKNMQSLIFPSQDPTQEPRNLVVDVRTESCEVTGIVLPIHYCANNT